MVDYSKSKRELFDIDIDVSKNDIVNLSKINTIKNPSIKKTINVYRRAFLALESTSRSALFFSLSVVAKELKKRHRSRSLSLLPNPF
jgi:hypothetical protein